MEEVLTAPRSPWQDPFAERLVDSIRRECLDQVIVWQCPAKSIYAAIDITPSQLETSESCLRG
jgi:hypothetical protein